MGYQSYVTQSKKTTGEPFLTEKLLCGYFTDSKNVRNIHALAEIAEVTGIDRNKALEVLQDKSTYTNKVRKDERTAQQIGASGVPYVVINQKYATTGAQPLETFSNTFQKAWKEQ